VTYQRPWPMFLLYSLSLGAPIWPIVVWGPRVRPVWAHSSYATGPRPQKLLWQNRTLWLTNSCWRNVLKRSYKCTLHGSSQMVVLWSGTSLFSAKYHVGTRLRETFAICVLTFCWYHMTFPSPIYLPEDPGWCAQGLLLAAIKQARALTVLNFSR
jgi:hypothetical protein